MSTPSVQAIRPSRKAVPTVVAEKRDVRISQREATRILRRLEGMTAPEAHQCLRFRAGLVSAQLSRVLEQGLAEARRHGVDQAQLVVCGWSLADGENVRRLRRLAHGVADWIDTATTAVTIELAAPPRAGQAQEPGGRRPAETAAVGSEAPAGPAGSGGAPSAVSTTHGRIMNGLRAVIDPDLGVNIVDLGFVRTVAVTGRAAHLHLTLTNPFCPITSVITDQVRHELVGSGLLEDVTIDWVFSPPWSTDDISPEAREELRAIGFSGM